MNLSSAPPILKHGAPPPPPSSSQILTHIWFTFALVLRGSKKIIVAVSWPPGWPHPPTSKCAGWHDASCSPVLTLLTCWPPSTERGWGKSGFVLQVVSWSGNLMYILPHCCLSEVAYFFTFLHIATHQKLHGKLFHSVDFWSSRVRGQFGLLASGRTVPRFWIRYVKNSDEKSQNIFVFENIAW